MSWTLGELAERVGGEVSGDRLRRISGVRTLEEAEAGDLSFLTHPRYARAARESRAGAVLVGRGVEVPGHDLLVAEHPTLALAQLLALVHPPSRPAPGVHPTAIIGPGAEVDPSASLGAYVVLGAGARIGPNCVLHPHVVVGESCRLGAGVVLHPHVVLYARVVLGDDCEVHAGTVLGSDGFGYATVGGVHHKIPQVGRVEIGERVEIGALSAVDRALLGSTSIGPGSKIDNLVQVGHNVTVGRSCVLCGQAGIAGSARLGDGVVLAGQSGVVGHVELGSGVQVAAKSAVLGPVEAGQVVAGIPAVEISVWRRTQAVQRRLADLWRRLRAMERRLGPASGSGERRDDTES